MQTELFSTTGAPRPEKQGRFAPWIQALSLAATGAVLWKLSIGPRLLRQPFLTVAGLALFYAITAWLWSAAVTFVLFLLLPRREGGDRPLETILRTSTVAVWFAPATVLLASFSPAALAAALALIVTATRLLYTGWMEHKGPGATESAVREPFALLQAAHRTWTPDLAAGLLAAALLQCGTTALLSRHWLAASALFGMSTAVLTLFALTSGAAAAQRSRPLPQTGYGIAMTILLAAGLTIGGIGMRGGNAWGWGFGQKRGPAASAREIMRELFEPARAESARGAADNPPGAPVQLAPLPPGGDFPGVILWPELRKVTTLIDPLLPTGGGAVRAARTYSIPFGGEYWIYRLAFRRPPPNSWKQRGSPAALSFRSTDHWPLKMEAHQKLDPPVDLSCCRKVRVEIWNADRYPGTVTLELLAVDRTGAHTVSLGIQPVLSAPNLSVDPITAIPESIDYQVPGSVHECGEFQVMFNRSRSRAEKSARIAVDRFVLLP